MIFSKAAFGCPIPEGYGQTEATCSITFSHPLDPSLGNEQIFLTQHNIYVKFHVKIFILKRTLWTTSFLLYGQIS
jgi:hypothetical protein